MAGQTEALPARSVLSATAFSLLGLFVWAAHLAFVYGLHHIGCAAGGDPQTIAAAIVLITVLAVLGLIAAGIWPGALARLVGSPGRDDPLWPFLLGVMRWLALLGGMGVVWAALALQFLATCAP